MDTTPAAFTLRAAELRDLQDLVALIGVLAEYERLAHLVEATPDKLGAHLFGARPAAEALVAETSRGKVVGFALFFTNFSTFLCKPGLYLEDLFVLPEQRGLGIGKALLKTLAGLAVARGCGRFEWSVLDRNAPSIGFYEAMGASVLTDWRICRVSGAALDELAG